MDTGKLVLWDEDTDGGGSGLYGTLDKRRWVAQGPDGSTWRTQEDRNSGANTFEQFIYNTEGLVVSTTGASPGVTVHGEDVQSNLRYLWRGGRNDGDGLVMMPGGSEQDTHRGTPLGDDAYAYQRYVAGGFFDSENVEWTVVQEKSADAGTQGTWSVPSTWGAWTDFSGKYDAFRPSEEWP